MPPPATPGLALEGIGACLADLDADLNQAGSGLPAGPSLIAMGIVRHRSPTPEPRHLSGNPEMTIGRRAGASPSGVWSARPDSTRRVGFA